MLRRLNIQHRLSSAYQPEIQGALERFHQLFKTMLCTYSLEARKDWGEGVPLLLFAIWDTVQESADFSPAKLVFRHILPFKDTAGAVVVTEPSTSG